MDCPFITIKHIVYWYSGRNQEEGFSIQWNSGSRRKMYQMIQFRWGTINPV